MIVFFLSPAAVAFSVLVLHDWTRVLHVSTLQRRVRRQAKSEQTFISHQSNSEFSDVDYLSCKYKYFRKMLGFGVEIVCVYE